MAKKFLSLRAHDMMRTHHPNDASAEAAQRAMVDAQKRHSKKNSIPVLVRNLEARHENRRAATRRQRASSSRREHEHPSTQQWAYFLASEDMAAFVCRSLGFDLASLEVAHWLKQIRALQDTELASLIRACAPAAMEHWQQEERHRDSDPYAGDETRNHSEPIDSERLRKFLDFLETLDSEPKTHSNPAA